MRISTAQATKEATETTKATEYAVDPKFWRKPTQINSVSKSQAQGGGRLTNLFESFEKLYWQKVISNLRMHKLTVSIPDSISGSL